MEDHMPGDQHSSWRDILDSKAHKENKEHSRIFQNLSLSTITKELNRKGDIEYGDADSQWSDSESLLSTCFSTTSTSGTRSTKTSFPSRGSFTDEDDSDDERNLFPSFDDVGYYGHLDTWGLRRRFGMHKLPSPACEDLLAQIEHPVDDTAIRKTPTRHVDYLSHEWCEQDLWASWRLITSKREASNNSMRLINASWRAWGKMKSNLRAVSSDDLNWMRDCDVTWLYGPLQPGSENFLDTSSTSDSRVKEHKSPNHFLNKKPILKKRTMSEIMLSQSISSSSLLKQATAAVLAQQSELRRHAGSERARVSFAPILKDSHNASGLSSIFSSGLASPMAKDKRRIHFNEQVEQFIAVDMKGDDENDDNEPQATHNNDDSDSDDGSIMTQRSNSRGELPARYKRREDLRHRPLFGLESKTIEMLPSTTLKYREEISEPEETAVKYRKGFCSRSKLSPSPSRDTSRLSKSPTRIFIGDDEEDDDTDLDLELPSAFINHKDRISVTQETPQSLHMSGSLSIGDPAGMRKTPSEDDVPSEGLSGNPVQVVNTDHNSIHSKWGLLHNIYTERTKMMLSTLFSSPNRPGKLQDSLSSVDHQSFISEANEIPSNISKSLSDHGSDDVRRDGTFIKQELSMPIAESDIIGTDETCRSLASQLPIGISSSESFNATDGEVDGYQTPTGSCSGESDETGSSNGLYQELCDVADEGTDGIPEVLASTLDPMRQALVDRVMEEFWMIFNPSWDTGFREYAGTSSSSSSAPSWNGDLISESASPLGPRKRRRGDDEPPNDKKGRGSRTPQDSVSPSGGPEEGTRFACPFRKHSSRLYSVYSHPVCALSHWETIARVKEHLYRGHRMVVHCKRCWKTFKNQEQLDAHLTVAGSDICDLEPGHPPEGITPEQERRLRSRKKTSPNQSEGDRWRDIYKLLFPNEEIPSPYFEPLQEETPMSPDSRELANYEDYIRRELPRLVRSNIEEAVRREMQPFEASLISNLVEIIQDCQDRVFRSYREAQGLGSEIQMPPTIDAEASVSSTLPENMDSSDSRPLDQYSHEQSSFIDTIFAPPAAQSSESIFPSLTGNASRVNLPTPPGDMILSDSGYASEQLQLCGCSGPCNCGTSLGQHSDDNTTQEIGDYSLHWDEWNQHPPWNELDSVGSGFDWRNRDSNADMT